MDETTPYSITVLAGAHVGATLELETGAHAFGRDPAADVVMTDLDLAPRHFTLDLTEGDATLKAHADGVLVDGRAIGTEQAVAVGFPIDIRVHDMHLRVDGPATAAVAPAPAESAPAPQRPTAPRRSASFAAGLFVVSLGLSIYAVSDGFGKTVGPAGLARMAAPVKLDQQAAEAARFISERLAKAGLASALTAEPVDGAVRITGTVAPERQSAWVGVQRDFDTAYGGRIAMHVTVASAEGPRPALAPQAIWIGPSPYVVTASGEHAVEGTVLDDGWTIDRILADRIVLHRGAQTYALSF